MCFPCWGWPMGIPTQHSLWRQSHHHIVRLSCMFSVKTPLCPRVQWSKGLTAAWTAKAGGCVSTHLWFMFLSASFLSSTVVAPDLHLPKWKQKKELSTPVMVCVYRKCLSNIAANVVSGYTGPGKSSSWSHQIYFIVNTCACMHLWMENL